MQHKTVSIKSKLTACKYIINQIKIILIHLRKCQSKERVQALLELHEQDLQDLWQLHNIMMGMTPFSGESWGKSDNAPKDVLLDKAQSKTMPKKLKSINQ